MFKLRSQFLDKAVAQFQELYLRMGIALKILITIDKEILQLKYWYYWNYITEQLQHLGGFAIFQNKFAEIFA